MWATTADARADAVFLSTQRDAIAVTNIADFPVPVLDALRDPDLPRNAAVLREYLMSH